MSMIFWPEKSFEFSSKIYEVFGKYARDHYSRCIRVEAFFTVF